VGVMLHHVPPYLRIVSLLELGMLMFRRADIGTHWGLCFSPSAATSIDSASREASNVYRFHAVLQVSDLSVPSYEFLDHRTSHPAKAPYGRAGLMNCAVLTRFL
jgi:hypothetical protein